MTHAHPLFLPPWLHVVPQGSSASGTHRLFETIPVDPDHIATLLTHHYEGYRLGDRIKASQNHTFRAHDASGQPVIVRVTPDPAHHQRQRIEDELTLIIYLHHQGRLQSVCLPIPPTAHAASTTSPEHCIVQDRDLLLVVFQYAKGTQINPVDWAWIRDRTLARSWGHWAGQLHHLCRRFEVDMPHVARRFRRWDEIHDGVMQGVEVAEEDLARVPDPRHFGILHGDINISNFFWKPPPEGQGEGEGGEGVYGRLHVFDWDQVQRGWYLYDLTMVVYFPYMLSRVGVWLDGSTDLPGGDDYQQWVDAVVEGYNHAARSLEGEEVDRAMLERMVLLRRSFYERFCRRGLREMDEDLASGKADAATQAGMRVFMQWVVDWLDREAAAATTAGDNTAESLPSS